MVSSTRLQAYPRTYRDMLNRITKISEQILLVIACISVAIMVVVISADTLLRYVFNSPLSWAYNLTTYYLIVICFYFAISATFRDGVHISIDLFRFGMSKNVRLIADITWVLLSIIAFGLIAYANWKSIFETFVQNQHYEGIISWPVWLSYVPIFVGTCVLIIRLTLHVIALITKGNDPDVIFDGEQST